MLHAHQDSLGPGTFDYDAVEARWHWSAELFAIYGLDPAGTRPTTELLLGQVVPEDREAVAERLERHLREAGAYSCTYGVVTACGGRRSVVLAAESRGDGARVTQLHGFVVDITRPLQQTVRAAVSAAAEHRAAIEQVKGALMLTYGISDDAAFGLLRGYSNRSNLKLAEIAEYIAERLSTAAYRELEPATALLRILNGLTPSRLPQQLGADSQPAASA